MRTRNILFIILICIEIGILLFLAIKKSNHNLFGFIALGATVILLITSFCLMLFPKREAINPTGKYEYGVVDVTMIDESRVETYVNSGEKRCLEVKFWYPKGDLPPSSCPLVIFSHGSFGNVNNNETLMKELASKGYIAASIGYTYLASEVTINNRKIKMSSEFRKEVMKISPEKNKEEALNLYRKWMDLTTKDACFVIDSILSKNEEFYSLVDKTKICVMGHSFGGATSLALGRIRSDLYCVVSLESPFMYDVKSVENGKFVFDKEVYPTRMLNVYSDSSYLHLSEWDQYFQNNKYLHLNDEKYQNVYLKGLGHMHLCDFQIISPFLSWILSSKDSSNTAKTNLELINKTIFNYFDSINF